MAARWGEAKRYVDEVVLQWNSDECLIWPFRKNPDGYGIIGKKHINTVVCEIVYGIKSTKEFESAHSCHVRACCNWRHLRWATHFDNVQDRNNAGNTPRGEKSGKSKLTSEQVLVIRELAKTQTRESIAITYGVRSQSIDSIVNGKTWSWLQAAA